MIDGRLLADYAMKELLKYSLIVLIVALLIGGVIGYALAFEITWTADSQDGAHGYRLYRHAGPCSDAVKKWRLAAYYGPEERQGSAPNSRGTNCYTLRAYREEGGAMKLSADSNYIQRPPIAPSNLQEVP